jgi:hypothetical protein
MITRVKRSGEGRFYNFNFNNQPELEDGQTITSVVSVVSVPSGLTLGTPAIAGSKVQTFISGGTPGFYFVVFTVTTSGSPTVLIGTGRLQIKDLAAA